MGLHVNWGRASAQQIESVQADSEGGNLHPLQQVDEELGHCNVGRAFDRAPRVPITETSTVSMFTEKVQVDLLFLGDVVALRVFGVFSKYSLSLQRTPRIPKKYGALPRMCGLRFFGRRSVPRWMQGGAWENEVCTDYCPERRIRLLLLGAGAHPMDS